MKYNFYKSLPSIQILPSRRSDVDGGTGSLKKVAQTQLWVEKEEMGITCGNTLTPLGWTAGLLTLTVPGPSDASILIQSLTHLTPIQ